MIWFFDRDNDLIRLETRYDNTTVEFVALVHYHDGRTLERRFAQSKAFREWLEAFERALEAQRWKARGGPVVLPYGWPEGA